jgi:hypothetical protein
MQLSAMLMTKAKNILALNSIEIPAVNFFDI